MIANIGTGCVEFTQQEADVGMFYNLVCFHCEFWNKKSFQKDSLYTQWRRANMQHAGRPSPKPGKKAAELFQ